MRFGLSNKIPKNAACQRQRSTRTDVGTSARLQGGRVTRSGAHVADTPGPGGSTPLIMACTQGILADVKLWLDYGANPALEGKQFAKQDGRRDYQVLPLTEAAEHGHSEVVKLLLSLMQQPISDTQH